MNEKCRILSKEQNTKEPWVSFNKASINMEYERAWHSSAGHHLHYISKDHDFHLHNHNNLFTITDSMQHYRYILTVPLQTVPTLGRY